jgi:UDP-N-acetylmuramoylalanine--D-glutamate ligase
MELKNKNITIIGAKKSGIGAAMFVKKSGGIPFVSDSAKDEKIIAFAQELEKEKISCELGGHTDKVYNCDLMVISPGVPSDVQVIKEAKKRNIKIISEIELAFQYCKGKIIAITGTNGKTTTTSLIGHILNLSGIKTYVTGNINIDAFSKIVLDVKKDEFVSLEVSSFQLDFINNFKPFVSIILNITPDHMNRYENKFENYLYSKYRVFENQDEKEFLIINADDENFSKYPVNAKANVKYFSLVKEQANGIYLSGNDLIYKSNGMEEFRCKVTDLSLKGEHNVANSMAAIVSAKIAGCDNAKIISALKSFEGVEHRLELVKEINGVKYINDSKATNIDSVWYALRSFNNPLFLILGGLDKGNDYERIKDLVVSKVKKIYAIGSSADKVYDFFHQLVKVEIKQTLQECVYAGSNEAVKGDIVLLSPACASFDMFDSYEHRGKVFKEVVESLQQ